MITCEHCKQPIQSKTDLIVMPQWLVVPRALHKACWGEISMQHGGVGSVSYQTGMLQNRRRMRVALNSGAFTALAVILFGLGLFIFFANISGSVTVTANGAATAATAGQIMTLKWIALVVLTLPILERLWSYLGIEKKISSSPQQ